MKKQIVYVREPIKIFNVIKTFFMLFGCIGIFIAVYNLVKAGNQNKMEKLLEKIKEKSCIDESLDNSSSDLLEWINLVQEYIELAEKLESIDKVNVATSDLENTTIINIDELVEKIKKYNKDKDNDLLYELNIYRELIEDYLNKPATIDRIVEYSRKAIKCKVADMCFAEQFEAANYADSIYLPDDLSSYQTGDLLSAKSNYEDYGILLNEEYSELLSRGYIIRKKGCNILQETQKTNLYDKEFFVDVNSLINDANQILVDDSNKINAISQPVNRVIR